MVGVPAFPRWVSGPSVRTTWPTFIRVSHRMVIGTQNEGQEQRRHHGSSRPEGEVPEEVEDDVNVGELGEEVIEHVRPPSPVRSALPRPGIRPPWPRPGTPSGAPPPCPPRRLKEELPGLVQLRGDHQLRSARRRVSTHWAASAKRPVATMRSSGRVRASSSAWR